MEENIKRKFDAFASIRDHAWREFKDKAKAEWRLSFGIWTALLAAIGALITSKLKLPINVCILSAVLVFIVILHGYFLYWVQCKLDSARIILHECQTEMRKYLDLSVNSYERNKWKQPAHIYKL